MSAMDNVICECCYVVHGWMRSCNCADGPMRTDPENPFGFVWPRTNTTMDRNERQDCTGATPAAPQQKGGSQ